jgi:hypothetical protein
MTVCIFYITADLRLNRGFVLSRRGGPEVAVMPIDKRRRFFRHALGSGTGSRRLKNAIMTASIISLEQYHLVSRYHQRRGVLHLSNEMKRSVFLGNDAYYLIAVVTVLLCIDTNAIGHGKWILLVRR